MSLVDGAKVRVETSQLALKGIKTISQDATVPATLIKIRKNTCCTVRVDSHLLLSANTPAHLHVHIRHIKPPRDS